MIPYLVDHSDAAGVAARELARRVYGSRRDADGKLLAHCEAIVSIMDQAYRKDGHRAANGMATAAAMLHFVPAADCSKLHLVYSSFGSVIGSAVEALCPLVPPPRDVAAAFDLQWARVRHLPPVFLCVALADALFWARRRPEFAMVPSSGADALALQMVGTPYARISVDLVSRLHDLSLVGVSGGRAVPAPRHLACAVKSSHDSIPR